MSCTVTTSKKLISESRASQKWRFLPDSKINVTNNKFKGYLPKKSLKFFFQNFWVTFRGAFFQLKFYYINRLSETSVKWSYQENSIFFQFSITNLYFFLLNLNSTWKMCSFQVHHVDVAQKLRKLKGGS